MDASGLAKRIGAALLITLVGSSVMAALPISVGHGVNCQPAFGQANQVGYGEPGIGNFSSTQTARIFCPVSPLFLWKGPTQVATVPVTRIPVYYLDNARNDPFWCYPYGVTQGGGAYWGTPKYTCSQPGGCLTNSNPTFTGVGVNTFLMLDMPRGVFTETAGFSCFLPRSESYASWVVWYLGEW